MQSLALTQQPHTHPPAPPSSSFPDGSTHRIDIPSTPTLHTPFTSTPFPSTRTPSYPRTNTRTTPPTPHSAHAKWSTSTCTLSPTPSHFPPYPHTQPRPPSTTHSSPSTVHTFLTPPSPSHPRTSSTLTHFIQHASTIFPLIPLTHHLLPSGTHDSNILPHQRRS
jgi:hypothetical protein